MSHSVTVSRRTVFTTSGSPGTSYLVVNTGYLKTFPGILKVLELLIGGAVVGIFSYYQTNGACWVGINGVVFAFLMAVTFMIGTFCLLLACLISLSTGGIMARTTYEFIYHSVACILLLISSCLLLISVSDRYRRHEPYFAASIMGLVNSVLYFISAFIAHRNCNTLL